MGLYRDNGKGKWKLLHYDRLHLCYMSYSLNYKGYIEGTTIGAIKGDTTN